MKKLLAFAATVLLAGFAVSYANEVVVEGPTKVVKEVKAELGTQSDQSMSSAF